MKKRILLERSHVFDVLKKHGLGVVIKDDKKYRNGVCDFVFELDESEGLCGCLDSSGCPRHPEELKGEVRYVL